GGPHAGRPVGRTDHRHRGRIEQGVEVADAHGRQGFGVPGVDTQQGCVTIALTGPHIKSLERHVMQLYIGNKNYSSWSLRAWLAMKGADIPFDEVVVPFDSYE